MEAVTGVYIWQLERVSEALIVNSSTRLHPFRPCWSRCLKDKGQDYVLDVAMELGLLVYISCSGLWY